MIWEELCAHIRSNYRVVRDQGVWLGALATVTLSKDQAVDQKVQVERVTVFDEAWVLIAAHVGPEATLPAREALLLSFRMAVGALALDQGHLYLRAALPLATLTLPAFERAFTFAANEAARIRAEQQADRPLPPVTHFSD